MHLLQVLSVRIEGEQQGRFVVVTVSSAAVVTSASSHELQHCAAADGGDERLDEET